MPLDNDTIFKSVKKTGKVIVLHEDTMIGGFGSELSSLINENCFKNLDAPVVRCASLDTPVPFSLNLEGEFLAKYRLKDKILKLYEY
jgi:2-oxoisovalerate dehydrogenase E1 component